MYPSVLPRCFRPEFPRCFFLPEFMEMSATLSVGSNASEEVTLARPDVITAVQDTDVNPAVMDTDVNSAVKIVEVVITTDVPAVLP